MNSRHFCALTTKQRKIAISFCFAPPGTESTMQSFCKFLAITFVSILASGSAIAQTSYYKSGPLPPNPPQSWLAQGRSVQEWDRYRYGYSSIRGRMGLGADPPHSEGPGNFSSPGR
jgi:hypothetical protein